MPKYEAHVTCPREASDEVRKVGELTGWKFSAFDADPIMGDKPFCYLTSYSQDVYRLRAESDALARLLAQHGVQVLREKIERIVFDTKTGVDEI